MENTQTSTTDPLGSALISLLTTLGVLHLLIKDYTEIIGGAIVFLGILCVILYYTRITRLPMSSRTPLSDATVVLGGLVVILHLLGSIVEIDALSVLSPYLGLGLIIGAIVAKLLLIDQVLERILVSTLNVIDSSLHWTFSSIYNATRLLSVILGIIVLSVHYFEVNIIPFVDWLASALFSLSIILTLVVDREKERSLGNRIVYGLLAGVGLVFILLTDIALVYLVPVILLLGLSSDLKKISSLLSGLLYRIVRITRLFFHYLLDWLQSIGNYIRNHPVTSLRIGLVLMALPAYFYAPEGDLGGVSWQLVLPAVLIFLAILPSLISFSITFIPQLYQGTIDAFRWLYSSTAGFISWLVGIAQNFDLLLSIGGLAGLISLFFIQDEDIYLQIGVASASAIMLSFAGRTFLMRFYDVLLYGFARLTSGIVMVIRRIIPQLEIGFIISFLSWIFLFMGLFYGSFFPSGPSYGRWLLFLTAIIFWNTAYEKRRKRFYRFLDNIFGGLWRRIRGLFSWVFRNLFIVLLWIVGLGFFVLSFGLIFAGSIDFVSEIFAETIENRLVSYIIALSFVGIGSLTLQQSVARRSQLQMSSEGRK